MKTVCKALSVVATAVLLGSVAVVSAPIGNDPASTVYYLITHPTNGLPGCC